MIYVDCNLCGAQASDAKPYRIVEDRYTGKSYQLVRCPACGLVYLNPRPTFEELTEHYPDSYEPFQSTDQDNIRSRLFTLDHEQKALNMQVDYLERFVPHRGCLLDVGCASGRFLNAAQQRGWVTQGVELNSKASQIARDLFGLDVYTGSLEEANFSENSFTAITLWDVLEHVPYPVDTLRLCWNLLLPGGILAFSIPNILSFDRFLFAKYWIGWDAPRHFTLFDQSTLIKALEQSKFEKLDLRCLLGGKGTFILSLKILIRHFHPSVRKYIRILPPIAGALTFPYRQFAYRLKRGPILFIAARKGLSI